MIRASKLYSAIPISSVIFAQTFFGGVEEPNLTQKIALYSKPSVVRIFSYCSGTYKTTPELGGIDRPLFVGGIGTGFFINSEGYIVTSAHVVEASQGGENECKQKLFSNLVRTLRNEDVSGSEDFIQEKSYLDDDFEYYQYVLLPDSRQNQADALPFDIKEIGSTDREAGNDIAIIKIQLSNTPVLKIGDSNDVGLGDSVIAIGYPVSGDRLDEFGDDSIVVSGVFEGTVSKTDVSLKDNTKVLELDISVGYGSSGSPVLNEQGEVIGMVTFNEDQAVNQALQGNATPLANRTNSLLEYVRQAGVDNESGNLDILYRDGLDFLWNGNLEGARSKFESVQDLFPQHSEIEPLLQDVRSSIAEMDTVQRNYNPFLIAIVGGGCFLGIGYWLFNRRLQNTQVVSSPSEVGTSVMKELPSSVPQSYRENSTRREVRQATVVSTDPYIELRNQSGQKHYLYLKEQVHTLGRDPEWSDIKRISDDGWPVISRRQATFIQEGSTYRIYDGDKETGHPSSNGIFLDDQPIDEDGHILRNGDCLVIGGDPRTQAYMTYYSPDFD